MDYANNLSFELKKNYLHAVYWIVPLALFLVLADMFFLKNYLKNRVLASNVEPLLFALIFGAPHILASMFAYCDKEYITYYKPNIIGGLIGAIVLSIITVYVLPLGIGLSVLAIITMYHFTGQQAGIAKMFLGQPIRYFSLWQAAIFTNSVIIVLMIGLIPVNKDGAYISGHQIYLPTMHDVLICYALFTTLLSVYIVRQVKQWRAAVYFIMTQAMSLLVTLFFYLDYVFLVFLLPNFVHDVTAYIFYTTHDANRCEKTSSNVIYRWLKIRPSWIVILLPVLSFILAIIFEFLIHYIVILVITYFHYYIEGVAWKKHTLHRKNIFVRS